MTKLFARVVLPLAAGGLLLAGCTGTQGGTASPASSPPASQGSSSAAPDPSSGAATTASLNPCELLTATDVSAFGQFKAPEQKELGGARLCSYLRLITTASDESGGVSVGIRDSQGIDSVNDAGGGKTTGNVNGRKAVQAPSPPAGCTLALAVGTAARVDVLATSTDATKACDLASQVADKVEPKLPKG
ncbi:DUF3558 family protein [Amycolatopsis stemonae]